MSKLIWIISAAAIAISAPAAAQGQGKGKGAGKSSHSSMAKGKGQAHRHGQAQTKVGARSDARATTRAEARSGRSVDRTVDRDGNGIADARERFVDRNRDGIDDRTGNRYGGSACPPGLAKKTPACVPPGQAKRTFSEGQRVPTGFDSFTDFNDIPLQLRNAIPSQYGSDAFRYIYRDNRVYVVDRRTRIVSDIINLLR